MDVPPMTTHDVVQAESQTAIDALRRLATTRESLAHLYQARPSLAEAHTRGARELLDGLPGFWASPATIGGETRTAMLGRHLAAVMKEEATLRGLDGTLNEEAASLAARASTIDSAALPAGVHLRELILGDAPHAGSLIVLEDSRPDLALLFTAHGGWEAFDSMDRLLDSTRRRLLESVDVADGSGLDDDTFAEAKTQGSIGSRDINGSVFATLANRMVDVQAARIALAADNFSLDSEQPDATKDLADRVRYELAPAAMLDIDAIESLREARLLEAATAKRLANVPGDVRAAWYEARDDYNDALGVAALLRVATGIQPPLTLHAFASRELAAKLASLGVDESPEAITVEIARIKVLPEPIDFLDPLPGSTKPRRMSLVDFACQNIGRFSLDTLHAMDTDNASLRGRLGHAAIRDMVRDLDIANAYQRHLEERLRQGPAGALARKLVMAVQAARMRLEAAEARLSYYLPGEPRSFIDDRGERGYRWVEAALDHPPGQRNVDQHDVAVSQLTYQQVPLDGILVFASRAAASAPRIVLYTPDAPDGRTFREFESRQDAAKRFFYHPAFREYLLDRLPAEFATVSPNGATRQFAGDRLAHWVLGANGDAAYTQTSEPFGERETDGDFFAASYDTALEKHQRDARFLARSTAEADNDALLGYVQDRLNISTPASVLASVVADLPASFARMAQASWRFYDHVKAGDAGQAFVAFAEGYGNAVGLIGPPFIGGRHIASAIVRSRIASNGVASTNVRLVPSRVRFDDRYAVHGLRKKGRPDDEGIYRVRGQSYIEQDGTHFLVHRDAGYDRWRLAPPQGAIDARFTGPLIERVDGRWVYASDVGLRGGMRRMRQRLRRLLRDENVPPAAAAGMPIAAEAPAAPGGPAAPNPNAPRPISLPPVMEPLRAEITAALTDNPSAIASIRSDGTHLKFVLRDRSALIVDPHLHPDLAELSAHQRRVFLHELDTRFPLHVERAEVLEIQGWAQAGGRRIPSPPASPGGAPGPDLQTPDISSSTGDSLPAAPALTPSQHGRWNEALAVARGVPRSPGPSTASTTGSLADILPATEVVPLDEWPSRIWYFSERRFRPEYIPALRREGVILGGEGAWVDAGTGVHTYPVSVLPPESPPVRLSEVLGASPVQQTGQRDPRAYSMLIDLERLRHPLRVDLGRFASREMELQLHRRLLPGGEYQYVLQSQVPVRIPSEYVISVSRRDGQPSRLPVVRP